MLIEFHRNMLADKPRNAAFYKALGKVIRKGKTTVADIGSGTGVLGFMASRLGAREVYMYEQADVMHLAEKLARANKISNCHFFHGPSAEMIDPPRTDVVVAEILGNYAFEENMIATLNDARRFLKPGGTVIPYLVEQFVCPVVTDRFYRELKIWDAVGFGLDFDEAAFMSLNNIYVRSFKPADLLGKGRDAKSWDLVDFRRKNASNRKGRAAWTIKANATVYGLALWWRADLVPGVSLSTAPSAPQTHWEQLYLPLLEPLKVKKGDRLSVVLSSVSTAETGTDIDWRVILQPKSGKKTEQFMDLRRGFIG